MLYQIHWQFKNGKTKMCAQNNVESIDEMEEWVKRVEENHVLPEGCVWLMCTMESEHFVMAVKENENEST